MKNRFNFKKSLEERLASFVTAEPTNAIRNENYYKGDTFVNNNLAAIYGENQIEQVFNYGKAHVRTVVIDGEPWFVAKDVCDVLEIGNVSKALDRLDEDEKTTITLSDSGGRPYKNLIVNEPGLYGLILGSRKNEAKLFKRWITHEVIPAIRKKGTYSAPQVTQTELMHKVTTYMVQKEQEDVERDRKIELILERVNNLDVINIKGTKRVRLIRMVSKYAFDHAITHPHAWTVFKQRFNIAFKTNLQARMYFHQRNNQLDSLTLPEFLEVKDLLDDAIRVADKMLNDKKPASHIMQ